MTKLLNNYCLRMLVALLTPSQARTFSSPFALMLLLVCDAAKLAESTHSSRLVELLPNPTRMLFSTTSRVADRRQTQMAHTKATPHSALSEAKLFCFTRGFRNNNFLSPFRWCQHVRLHKSQPKFA